jgi:hypothetical protein
MTHGDACTGWDVHMNMTLKPLHGRSRPAAAIVAVAALLFAIGEAQAATAPIYKCVGKDLGLIYTDQPCKGGEQIDIHPGDVDPAAVARLQGARDMLDRGATARLAEEQRAAAQKELAAMARRQRDEDRSAADAEYSAAVSPYDQYLSWYPGTGQMRPHHPPHKPPPPSAAPHRFAPKPPFVVRRS